MAKRFTDSEKWKKSFLRGLEGAYKLLWFYILDNCNHAGIWDVEFDVAKIRIGMDVKQDIAEKVFEEKIEIFDNGGKWFIPSFIEFQYGELNKENRAHKSVLIILKKYKLSKLLTRPLQGCKDKDMDMDKDKDKRFEQIWNLYPRKLGKDKAFSHFNTQVKTDKDFEDIKIAVNNYIKDIQKNNTEVEFIKHGSTWFNKYWKDWINYKVDIKAIKDISKDKESNNLIEDIQKKKALADKFRTKKKELGLSEAIKVKELDGKG